MKIVFSVGGSLVCPDELDLDFIKSFCSFVKQLSKQHRISIVVGGGRLARKYISASRSSSNEIKDLLGIEATHLNAMLVAACLGARSVYLRRVSPGDLKSNSIVVTVGTTPGHSTDAVAAEIAVKMKADLIVNASNIKGVFSMDPSKNPNAKLLSNMTSKELLEIVSNLPQTPGKYALIDHLAVETISKNKIKTIILNGRNLSNIRKAIEGKEFTGTLVKG